MENIKEWLEKDPKRTFKMFMGILVVSFIIMIVSEFITHKENNSKIPYLFENSETIIQKKKLEEKQKKISKINKELMYFKTKETLSKNDSIRIEFLLDQLNYIRNEK